MAIALHGKIHSFRSSRGKETAYLEDNLLQKLMDMMKEVLYYILLDLHKAYGALFSDRCLNIFGGYGVVPQYFCLIRRYWDRLAMVTRAGGYYRAPFKGYWGLIKLDPLSPILVNVVVGAMVWHWLMLVALEEVGLAGLAGLGRAIHRMAYFFYANDGVIPWPSHSTAQFTASNPAAGRRPPTLRTICYKS